MEQIPEVPASPVRLMKERFTEVKKLGAGNFGDAYLVLDKKYNSHRVVKRLQKSIQQMNPKTLAESRAEIANLSKVNHHHVVRFYRAWFDVDHHLHMLMEYCESGDLDDFVKHRFPLPEVLIRSLFIQLLVGMDEIHHNHLLHRDIKAKNIFMTRVFVGHPKSPDPEVRKAASEVGRHIDARVIPHIATDSKGYAIVLKIGDFGLSKALNFTEDKAKTVAGTPFHFSPELARQMPYTRRTDIWSLGVLFYFILTLSMPFRGKTIQEVFCSILREKVPHPATRFQELYNRPIPYSSELIEIVMDMLNKTESLRPTTEEILSRKYFGSNAPLPSASSSASSPSAAGAGAAAHGGVTKPTEQPTPVSNNPNNQQNETNTNNTASRPPSPLPAANGAHDNNAAIGTPMTHRMCVARTDAVVNIRAQPSLKSEIVGVLRHLDEIEVVRAVENLGHTWWHISKPSSGYCISAHHGKDLFVLKRSGIDPMRLSPLNNNNNNNKGGHSGTTTNNTTTTTNTTTNDGTATGTSSYDDDGCEEEETTDSEEGSSNLASCVESLQQKGHDCAGHNANGRNISGASAEDDILGGACNNNSNAHARDARESAEDDEDDEDEEDDGLVIVGHKEHLQRMRAEELARQEKNHNNRVRGGGAGVAGLLRAGGIGRNAHLMAHDDDDGDEEDLMMYSFSDATPPPCLMPAINGRNPRSLLQQNQQQQQSSGPSLQTPPRTATTTTTANTNPTPPALNNETNVVSASPATNRAHPSPSSRSVAAGAAAPLRPSSSAAPASQHRSSANANTAAAPPSAAPPSSASPRTTNTTAGSKTGFAHHQNNATTAVTGGGGGAGGVAPPPPPRKASPLAANRHTLLGGGGGHISPIRHRKSPQVVLPPLTNNNNNAATACNAVGGRVSPIKYHPREVPRDVVGAGVKRG